MSQSRGTICFACMSHESLCNKPRGGQHSHFKRGDDWSSEKLSGQPKMAQLISKATEPGFELRPELIIWGRETNLVTNYTLTSMFSSELVLCQKTDV